MATAPTLAGFTVSNHTYLGSTKPVYRAGSGPGVVVIHEVPGITPLVAGFAQRLVAAGMTVALPSLFGTPGKPSSIPYSLASMARACVSREFHCFALDRRSPITDWLRELARDLHDELGGPGVGAVGMCLTGGFGLAMLLEPSVIAPVLSQPSLPLAISAGRRRSAGLSEADWTAIEARAADGCSVLGLRFSEDRMVPDDRVATLQRRLGDRFIAVDIDSSEGNPYGIGRGAHSVLTEHLVDEPGHPTRTALDDVITFFTERLAANG